MGKQQNRELEVKEPEAPKVNLVSTDHPDGKEPNKLETDYQHALRIFEIQAKSQSNCWKLNPEDLNYEIDQSGLLTRRNKGANQATQEPVVS